MDGDDGKKKINRIEVKEWNAVATWTWEVELDLCAICRNHVNDVCIECQAENTIGNINTDCNIAWGKCNHAFHLHCIAKWLLTKEVCPLDNSDWQYQKTEHRLP